MLGALKVFAKTCEQLGGDLPDRVYGVPTWYKYFDAEDRGGRCSPVIDLTNDMAGSVIALLLAVFDILLFFAGVIAVVYVIYGSVMYIISQGEPDKLKNARTTIFNALIGLLIVMTATVVVNLIGNALT